jgi:hypothetical protein
VTRAKAFTRNIGGGDTISVKSFGAAGDGVTDDTAAIDAAFTYAGTNGVPLFVPDGIYEISDTILWPVIKGFHVTCAPLAVFRAKSTFPVDKKFFFPDTNIPDQAFTWLGGKLDGSLMPPRVVGAPDLLYLATPSPIGRVYIQGVWFYCNEDRTGTAGDSCLFLAGGRDYVIVGNKFQGATDAGIYMSGDPGQTLGEKIVCTGNSFIECNVGFITKRSFRRHIVSNNYVDACDNGITIGGEADTSLLPGQQAIITGNDIKNTQRGIEARISGRNIIANNRVIDFGLQSDGTPGADHGILINGSSHNIVEGNYIGTTGAFTPALGSSAILLTRRTYNGTDYDSTNNLIVNNRIDTVSRGIREEATCSDNVFGPNYITNASSTELSILGTNSTMGPVQTYYEMAVPTISLGGRQGEESLRVISATDAVNYIEVQGGPTGNATGTVISARGADTDISIGILPKGVGTVFIGGPAGSETMRVTRSASAANSLLITAGATGSPPVIQSRGSDTNVDLQLTTKGTGRVILGGTTGARFPSAAADPTGATNGEVYYNTATNKLKVYAGGSWVDLH